MTAALVDNFPASDIVEMDPEEAVQTVINYAAAVLASDLFIHTEEQEVELSVRRHGTVHRLCSVSREKGRHILGRIKALAGMDIAEHRRPMDGRWIYENNGKRLDMRINTLATLFGEDMTMRLWDRNIGLRQIDELGMTRNELNTLTALLNNPSGLILVTGPTGTGKTTTLYACMQYLTDGSRKISTLEDPVEFALRGVRQAQINHKLGLDFPELLRNVLRQAPDVIMIGEIRDQDTAATAVRAANSGHMVLATLHAPIAAGAVQSMLALGANPFFLSSCLLGILAQRLVRTLCQNCRVSFDISDLPGTFETIRPLLGPDEGKAIYGAGGCDECYDMGYAGRTGLFEIMTMNREIRHLIAEVRTSEEIQRGAVQAGMIEFHRAALLKVAKGITTTEEILRDVPPEYLGLED